MFKFNLTQDPDYQHLTLGAKIVATFTIGLILVAAVLIGSML